MADRETRNEDALIAVTTEVFEQGKEIDQLRASVRVLKVIVASLLAPGRIQEALNEFDDQEKRVLGDAAIGNQELVDKMKALELIRQTPSGNA